MTTGGAAVLGDGTTGRSRARSRWRRARWPLGVAIGIVLVGLLASVMRPVTSEAPLAPDNPAAGGARALAQILSREGVTVEYVRSSAQALALADGSSTLLVIGSYLLTEDQLDAIAESPADVVMAEPEALHLERVSGGAMSTGYAYDDIELTRAECTDPDATAAEAVESDGYGITGMTPEVVVCFPYAQAGETTGAYAVLEEDGRRVAAFDDAGLMTNERLDDDGNAALLLRMLGEDERLVWYIPSAGDTGEPTGGPNAATAGLLPAWTGPLAAQLAVLVLALALWRGRALGRIVTEPLPVTVRAAETTLGRGRLYRRSRSRGHAAAALRAGMARRAAARLGVPRTAGAPAVIDALARGTGRSSQQVADLLYGPPPTDDAALLQLARQLDELESEVHRT